MLGGAARSLHPHSAIQHGFLSTRRAECDISASHHGLGSLIAPRSPLTHSFTFGPELLFTECLPPYQALSLCHLPSSQQLAERRYSLCALRTLRQQRNSNQHGRGGRRAETRTQVSESRACVLPLVGLTGVLFWSMVSHRSSLSGG